MSSVHVSGKKSSFEARTGVRQQCQHCSPPPQRGQPEEDAMSASRFIRVAGLQIAAAVGGIAVALSAPAATPTAERVVLHASYAVFNDRAFIDVDALSDAVRAAGTSAIELRVCGTEALYAFKRTVPSLSGISLQPQIVDASDAACRAPAMLPAAATRAFAANNEAVAVRYWVEVAP
jgi:hypothetical protein